MNEVLCPPCPLCGLTKECKCARDRGPFELYDASGEANGSFVTIGLAVSCLRVLRKHCPHGMPFHPSLVDRHGCLVELPENYGV